jgi:hypothetical protein
MATWMIQQDYRHLRDLGFTEPEASSLIVLASRLRERREPPATQPHAWRFEELLRLEFLRYLVESGRVGELSQAPRR